MRPFSLLVLFAVLFFEAFALFANPSLPFSSPERSLAAAREALDFFDRDLSLSDLRILKSTDSREQFDLSPGLRRLYIRRRDLREELRFWEGAVSLQRDILQLSGGSLFESFESFESGEIAETAIRSFGELRQKYRMVRPAILHNILVNAGLRQEGFCWHWTRDLRERLSRLHLTRYELLWATAREGTPREHNTLVIVPKGKDLEDGLLLDGWRHSGSPFWTRVRGDKYPWKPGEYAGE